MVSMLQPSSSSSWQRALGVFNNTLKDGELPAKVGVDKPLGELLRHKHLRRTE